MTERNNELPRAPQLNPLRAQVSAAAVKAFGAGAVRGHAAAVLELADMEAYLAALADAERARAAVR